MIVDLIIPARNEESNIDALFAALPLDALRHVIVVDNGSTDRTAELAKSHDAIVVRETQPGYGAACLAGLTWIHRQEVPPDAVAFVDADLSDDPGELPRLIELIGNDEAELVIGSRPRRAEPGALTSVQKFGNALACMFTRLATGARFTDLGPMRVVRWSTLQAMNMTDRTWGWTVEMQFKAARRGIRWREIDVPYRRRHAGQSKISGSVVGSVKAGWRIITTIGRLWWRG